jgi:hypothetical protein
VSRRARELAARPPLASRATRVRLLAWSYEDAVMGGRDGVIGGKPQSKLLLRYEELWEAGSYKALEQAMDAQRQIDRFVLEDFRAMYVFPTNWLDAQPVSIALSAIMARMPENVFVPAAIAEAAGYLPSEAKVYERKRDRVSS